MNSDIELSRLQRDDLAIAARGISKAYTLHHQTERPDTLVGGIMQRARNPLATREKETFWALRDISFDIKRGEVVAFIGRNGAGKSTLLKVLSRITTPTAGEVGMQGRLGSLLEVGTGFNPELTGRENIFLNGSILGMKHREIQDQFDAIVDFSGVEQFLDTPVKRYSSGMYVRLAFAVAAHLNPEILIVDEVLAVGDAEFQKRCLGKMEDVAGLGRTVLFVSHNMTIVRKLCTRGIVMQKGQIVADAPVEEAVQYYMTALEDDSTIDLAARSDRRGNGKVRLCGLRIYSGAASAGSEEAQTPATGLPLILEFLLDNAPRGLNCIATIYNQHGQILFGLSNKIHSPADIEDPEMSNRYVCEIEELPLLPGRYRIDVKLRDDGELYDHLEGAAFFDVEPGAIRGRTVTQHSAYGNLFLAHRWITAPGQSAEQ